VTTAVSMVKSARRFLMTTSSGPQYKTDPDCRRADRF
jgi:hypothetical protein